MGTTDSKQATPRPPAKYSAADLLPPNATPLERRLSMSTAIIESIPVELRKLWDAQHCPAAFLPWLAWGLSVDNWQDKWRTTLKRTVIGQSLTTHKMRGTRAAVRHAIQQVLALADDPQREDITDIEHYSNSFIIQEWWEKHDAEIIRSRQKDRPPLTFEVQLLIGQGVLGGRGILGGDLYRALHKAIDEVKPLSTRYSLSIGGAKLETQAALASNLRTLQYARFSVEPKFMLALRNDLSATHTLRYPLTKQYRVDPKLILALHSQLPATYAIRHPVLKQYRLKPEIKLQLDKTLGLQPAARALQTLQLNMRAENAIQFTITQPAQHTIRSIVQLRLAAKLN